MELYCIQNQEGKFFKPTGYSGSGQHWNDELSKAKFYTKIGPCKTQVTFWAKRFPDFGVPKILKFSLDVSQAEIMEMDNYVEGQVKKKKDADLKRQKSNLERQHKELGEKIKKLSEL